jgi:hypothetical protein
VFEEKIKYRDDIIKRLEKENSLFVSRNNILEERLNSILSEDKEIRKS